MKGEEIHSLQKLRNLQFYFIFVQLVPLHGIFKMCKSWYILINYQMVTC